MTSVAAVVVMLPLFTAMFHANVREPVVLL